MYYKSQTQMYKFCGNIACFFYSLLDVNELVKTVVFELKFFMDFKVSR